MTVSFSIKSLKLKREREKCESNKKNWGFKLSNKKRKKYFHVHSPLVPALRYSPREQAL